MAKVDIVQRNLLKSEFAINFILSLFAMSLETFFVVYGLIISEKKKVMFKFVFLYSCPLLYGCQ